MANTADITTDMLNAQRIARALRDAGLRPRVTYTGQLQVGIYRPDFTDVRVVAFGNTRRIQVRLDDGTERIGEVTVHGTFRVRCAG